MRVRAVHSHVALFCPHPHPNPLPKKGEGSPSRYDALKKWLCPLLHNQHGVALIEFALLFPFFFLLLFGGLEIARLMLVQQRLERAGYVLADITTQYQPATAAAIAGEISQDELTNNVFPQLSRIMNPYDDPARQAIILTSLKREGGDTVIAWQQASAADTLSGCDNGTPQTCVKSVVNGRTPSGVNAGVAGERASLPSPMDAAFAGMADGANVIVAEVFYRYEPSFGGLLQGVGTAGGDGAAGFRLFIRPRIYAKRTFFAPRNGALLALPPSFPVQ